MRHRVKGLEEEAESMRPSPIGLEGGVKPHLHETHLEPHLEASRVNTVADESAEATGRKDRFPCSRPLQVAVRPSIWRRANEHQRRDLELLLREMEASSAFELQCGEPEGGWGVRLGLTAESLIVALVDHVGLVFASKSIPLEPLRGLIRTYLTLIQRMGDAISAHHMTHLEALDMARRGAHNEASQQIQEALEEVMRVDLETARRLFTVLCLVYDTPSR